MPGTVDVERIGRVIVEQGLKHRAQCGEATSSGPSIAFILLVRSLKYWSIVTATDFAFSCCSRVNARLLSW